MTPEANVLKCVNIFHHQFFPLQSRKKKTDHLTGIVKVKKENHGQLLGNYKVLLILKHRDTVFKQETM